MNPAYAQYQGYGNNQAPPRGSVPMGQQSNSGPPNSNSGTQAIGFRPFNPAENKPGTQNTLIGTPAMRGPPSHLQQDVSAYGPPSGNAGGMAKQFAQMSVSGPPSGGLVGRPVQSNVAQNYMRPPTANTPANTGTMNEHVPTQSFQPNTMSSHAHPSLGAPRPLTGGPPSAGYGPPISTSGRLVGPDAMHGGLQTGPPGPMRGPITGPPTQSSSLPRGPFSGPPTEQPIRPPSGVGRGPPGASYSGNYSMPPANTPRGPPTGPPIGSSAPPSSSGAFVGAPTNAYGQQSMAANAGLASGNFQQSPDVMDAYGAGAATASKTASFSEEFLASQCSYEFMRPTVSVVPYSQESANKSHITLGIVIRPLAPQVPENELAVVNFGQSGVIRCRHCRTYVNPFVHWVDNGRRWRCNLCGISNDVPTPYFCHLNANQQRQDRLERPELCCGSVEIVAPSEYMMRPPQPPCYIFVIDVSAPSIVSGAFQVIIETIKEQLDNLPGNPRTRVGFVTYDSTIHFYNLKSSLKAPQMMVIGDLNELFIPIPDELLVNLSDSREVIETLLNGLPAIHQNTRNVETALGSAIRVAFKLMSSIGGKMLVFQSSLPTTGQGALRNRENPSLIGSDKEHSLLNPVDMFYRSQAIEFCRHQVSVDTFLFASQYTDLASLGCLSRFSAGQVYYYPGFTVARDGQKLKQELSHCLTRDTAWEAVMRVRCTKGMRLANFYGNSFLRGPDLLALPTCNSDASFAVEIVHSDALLSSPTISVQAALLYTNSVGERRIRVHTICLPVSKLFAEIFRSVDVDTLCNLTAKCALETCLKTGFGSSRERLQAQCAEVVRAYRTSGSYGANSNSNTGYQVQLPESLQLMPLYIMSLLKNPAFRGGNDLNPDQRCYFQYQLNNMSVNQSRFFIYPRMFGLHNMPPSAGLPMTSENSAALCAGKDQITLPPNLNLSIERMTSDGIFLLEDSMTIYLWIGRTVAPSMLSSLLGIQSMEGVNPAQVQLLEPHDDYSRRVHTIIEAIREENPPFMELVILREGDPSEGRFFWKLVEDRASFHGGTLSYAEFLGQLSRSCLAGTTR